MRLLTVIEAPRTNIANLISRHELLPNHYYNEWVHSIAMDPEDATGAWNQVSAVFVRSTS